MSSPNELFDQQTGFRTSRSVAENQLERVVRGPQGDPEGLVIVCVRISYPEQPRWTPSPADPESMAVLASDPVRGTC